MRSSSSIPILLPVVIGACVQFCAAGAPAGPDPTAVKEVMEGRRDTANAAWWGFDVADATRALQAAVNSKARRVIVPDMGRPWIVTGIKLAGDQEIVFENGVEVQAKRGAFKDPGSCLFSAREKRNIKLTGPGATLRMWKADYQGADYKKAEWRHALAFWSCDGVEITGLAVVESGGDGLYLGCNSKAAPCSRVVVRDVRFLGHHRQGVSVICAEHLLIENCELRDTSGTAPQAGIDFEPNEAGERLVDCVMRGCKLEGNAGGAFLFALGKMRPHSPPVSVTIEDCRSSRDSQAVSLGMHPPVGVGGSIAFRGCRFAGTTKGGVYLRNLHAGSARLAFERCEFVNLASATTNGAPVCFRSDTFGKVVGGVRFDDCKIEAATQQRPVSFQNAGTLPMRDVTGRITVKAAGETKTYVLDDEQIAAWFPSGISVVNLPVIEVDAAKLAPAWPPAGPRAYRAGTAKQRHEASYAIWAGAGQTVPLAITSTVVGKGRAKPLELSLASPSGKAVPLRAADSREAGGGATHVFTAAETGTHRLVCRPGSNTILVNSNAAPVCALAPDGAFSFIYAAGDQYFLVPAGTKEFAITVGGDGAEKVKASVFDADGKQAWSEDDVDAPRQFHHQRAEAARDEIWRLRCEKPAHGVCEDWQVLMEGIPAVLAPSPEAVLGVRTAPATEQPRSAP